MWYMLSKNRNHQQSSEEEKKKYLVNPKDKYDHMVKINPELENLLHQLDLKLED